VDSAPGSLLLLVILLTLLILLLYISVSLSVNCYCHRRCRLVGRLLCLLLYAKPFRRRQRDLHIDVLTTWPASSSASPHPATGAVARRYITLHRRDDKSSRIAHQLDGSISHDRPCRQLALYSTSPENGTRRVVIYWHFLYIMALIYRPTYHIHGRIDE